MLRLYHASSSVCSQKVRVALAEKQLPWDSALIDISKGEQFAPEYMALNPEAVVPTLLDDSFVVRESSVILAYVDRLSGVNPLMPRERRAEAATQLWLLRTLDIHAAINTMSFATVFRERDLRTRSPEEMEQRFARLPNRQIAAKRRDLYERGAESVYVDGALHTLKRMFEDMQAALTETAWVTGARYGLADTALIAYVDRLERLGLDGLWTQRYPKVGSWLQANRERPSYEVAIASYIQPAEATQFRAAGEGMWPAIARRLA